MTDWDEGMQVPAGPAEPQGGWLRRKRFLIIGLAVAVALSYLGFTAFQGASMYYLTVDELVARGEAAQGEQVRQARICAYTDGLRIEGVIPPVGPACSANRG